LHSSDDVLLRFLCDRSIGRSCSLFGEDVTSDVRGENDLVVLRVSAVITEPQKERTYGSVFEVDFSTLRIRESALVEDLKEDVGHI